MQCKEWGVAGGGELRSCVHAGVSRYIVNTFPPLLPPSLISLPFSFFLSLFLYYHRCFLLVFIFPSFLSFHSFPLPHFPSVHPSLYPSFSVEGDNVSHRLRKLPKKRLRTQVNRCGMYPHRDNTIPQSQLDRYTSCIGFILSLLTVFSRTTVLHDRFVYFRKWSMRMTYMLYDWIGFHTWWNLPPFVYHKISLYRV